MSDYISELRQDLVEAAAREQRRGRAARVARPLRPRAWSPPAVAGALAIAAVLVAVVLTLTTVAPPPQPADPKVIATVRLDGQPRDAVLAGGSLWVADYEGRVLQLDPVRRRVRARIGVGGTPLAVAAEGDTVLVVSNESSPGVERSRLTTLDARTGRVVTSASFAGYTGDLVAFGAGGLWRSVHGHGGAIERLDLDTRKRTALIPDIDVFGVAATERSLWTREPNTLSERDASGRLVNRVRGLSRPINRPSGRTLLPDADGAWVVGQSDGLLYRVESGRVVRRVKVGQTAGVVGRAGPAVWVSATSAPDTYELVRVDPDDGKVTGRMRLGWRVPQVIVPVGKRLWVITSGGDAILVSPE